MFWQKNWPIMLVVTISLLLCGLVFFKVIVPKDTFHWDESHHALYSLWITKDIQAGDWDAFWQHTHHQALWPFLHSWIGAGFMLIFGISYVTARASNLFLFLLLLLLTFLTGRALDRERGIWIGLAAWMLSIFSFLLWQRAAENMTEALGALLTLAAFFSLLKLEQTKKWVWIAPLSIALCLALVTKYNYAFYIYVSVTIWAIYELVQLLLSPRPIQNLQRKEKKKNLPARPVPLGQQLATYGLKYALIAFPLLLTFWWWILGENREKKWQMILWSKENTVESHHQVTGLLDYLLFYFKAILFEYSWFTVCGALIIIGLLGIFLLMKKKKNEIFMLAGFAWTSLLLAIFFFRCREPRYMYSFVPLIFLTSAYFWVDLVFGLLAKVNLSQRRMLTLVGLAVFLFLLIPQGRPMFDYFSGRIIFKTTRVRIIDVLDYFREKIPHNVPVASGVALKPLSPYVFRFHFHDWQAPFYDLYTLPQAKFKRGMYLVTIKLGERSLHSIEEDSINKWNKFIEANRSSLELVDTRNFPDIEIKAEIYRIK